MLFQNIEHGQQQVQPCKQRGSRDRPAAFHLATVALLDLNRPALVRARQAWVTVGWHPPKE
jgi:hypothetical protein